jgi:hypothetical protein
VARITAGLLPKRHTALKLDVDSGGRAHADTIQSQSENELLTDRLHPGAIRFLHRVPFLVCCVVVPLPHFKWGRQSVQSPIDQAV